jgi:hypothetical protein
MYGVVKLASKVGAMAGGGAVATTVTLSGYINTVEGIAVRKRVNKSLHGDRDQGAIILMLRMGATCMTADFDHDLYKSDVIKPRWVGIYRLWCLLVQRTLRGIAAYLREPGGRGIERGGRNESCKKWHGDFICQAGDMIPLELWVCQAGN